MKINIDCCFFVLENILNENKRKNDIKKLKIIVDKSNNLISIPFDNNLSMKENIRKKIEQIIGNNVFHLEQVYTLGEKKFYENGINIIYLAITNEENIKRLDDNYKLIDFDIIKNKQIIYGDNSYFYETKWNRINNSLEYYHNIKTNDLKIERILIELITSYKQIKSKVDYSDIIFKFLPKYYTLEDVRSIYEKIKDVKVDKSNFRKKIMKYCKITNRVIDNKGYRPTHLYEFIFDENDIWL